MNHALLMMSTMSMLRNASRNRHTSSTTRYSTEYTAPEKTFDHIEYDVMKSKYSKFVVKTYKTRHGAENFCRKNGMDVACVKARMVK